jgi:hypothetical protein
MPARLGGGFPARPGARLGQDVRDVPLHGVAPQEQLGSDVRVRPVLCRQLGDLQFGRVSAADPAIRGGTVIDGIFKAEDAAGSGSERGESDQVA